MKPEEEPLLPEAAAIVKNRRENPQENPIYAAIHPTNWIDFDTGQRPA
jgi:hypothetical protein